MEFYFVNLTETLQKYMQKSAENDFKFKLMICRYWNININITQKQFSLVSKISFVQLSRYFDLMTVCNS